MRSMADPAPQPARSSAPPPPEPPLPPTGWQKFKRILLGGPKDFQDPHLFHTLSLAAFLAWVGLGADGLSSSSYGPEEAFKNLGEHQYLAVFLALATGLTVLIISAAYTKIIEHFPFGGGGYIVTSRLIGPRAGVVSGAALLIDYVLTCTTSIAAGGEAIFSNFPHEWHVWKLPVELTAISMLTILNLRGIKESIRILLPVFLTFLLTHVILIGGSVGFHLGRADEVASSVSAGLSHDFGTMGFLALALLFLRAYSRGAGTSTGIEAVSNGLSIMREPRVLTGKRTMVYMSTSLAVTAGGIILGYLLMGVHPVPGKTMNYRLAEMLAGAVHLGPLPVGEWYVIITIFSEALLLFVAAQAGFIAGPRVMANLAQDSFLPHRFGALSDRLTMQNGVLLMGGASFLMLLYTRGSVDALVVMYAINVFVTFALSQLGMIRYWRRQETRKRHPRWRPPMTIAIICFLLCAFILVVNLLEKFTEGAWLAVVDSATFQGIEEVDRVREQTEEALKKYVELARGMGIPADYRMSMGTEAISECERLAAEVAKEYERSIFFAGKLIFERERWWDRVLHNETAYQIQRRLQFAGLPMVVLPVRVLE